jgi:hypothetical protein
LVEVAVVEVETRFIVGMVEVETTGIGIVIGLFWINVLYETIDGSRVPEKAKVTLPLSSKVRLVKSGDLIYLLLLKMSD